MKKYRKKPVVIEAVQFKPTIDNQSEWPSCIIPWTKEKLRPRNMSWGYIKTLEGKMHVMTDDWIIKDVQGEFYPCKPDIFKMTYEAINE